MGRRIHDIGRFHELREQKGMYDPIRTCVPAHNVPLRVDCIGINICAPGEIDGDAVAIADESSVVLTVERTVPTNHPALGIDTTEKGVSCARTIDSLESSLDQ
jgi:hypothetical protein